MVQGRRPQADDRLAGARIRIRPLLDSKVIDIANRMQHDCAHKSGIVRCGCGDD
jgi:hypothetical protein